MRIKAQRREYLKLRHNRILQGMAIKIAFSAALFASILLLYNLLRFDVLLLISSISVLCCLPYLIYQRDSRKLIEMEHELGSSKEDRLSISDRVVSVFIAIISLFMLIITVVLFLRLIL